MKTTAKNFRKALAIMLCLAMCAALLVPVASAETDPNAIPISSEADLIAIESNPSGSYVLTKDIVLSSTFAPLCSGSAPFKGTLDGAGFAIKNLQLDDVAVSNYSTSGLFDVTDGATIKNLSVHGAIFNETAGNSIEIGGIVAHASNTTFINCNSYVDITTGSNSMNPYLGGIVGLVAASCTFTNCASYGEIDVTSVSTASNTYVGGLVGFAKDDVTMTGCVNYATIAVNVTGKDCFVGGVIGCADGASAESLTADAYLTNCVNYGAVTATCNKTTYAAGVIGVSWYDKNVMELTDCINYADVTVNGTTKTGGVCSFVKGKSTIIGCENFGKITAKDAAGILCIIYNTTTDTIIKNCVNFGEIVGASNYVAGITVGTYSSCSGKPVKILISRCANYGNITTSFASNQIWAAGIFARNNAIPAGSTIEYCYNAGTISAPNKTGGYFGGIAGVEASMTCTNNYSSDASNALFGHNTAANETYKTGNEIITAETDLAAVVATLNTGLETPAYRLNNGQIELLYSLNSDAVVNVGTQETEVKDGKFSVRFVSYINSISYESAGFVISAVIEKNGQTTTVAGKTYAVSTVFDSLTADSANGLEKIESPMGTDYLAVVMNNIPADATVTFTFTPYAVFNGETINGNAITMTYVNGVLA